ncbi:MAG: hypothetical protein KA248_00810 [Kiritimatiellae bacterium]|nr:hypothetical protein [Kiritimatiellia bacterium]
MNTTSCWPHAPPHRLSERGLYVVTSGTYLKAPLLHSPVRLTLVRDLLLESADRWGWNLQAWAVLCNHYHFVALSPDDPGTLRWLIARVHELSAKRLNRLDGAPGRKVWHNYWDTRILNQVSRLARLRYVHQNPVHHGVADNAANYAWCSQGWLERTARPSFVKTLETFKTDKVNIPDDF